MVKAQTVPDTKWSKHDNGTGQYRKLAVHPTGRGFGLMVSERRNKSGTFYDVSRLGPHMYVPNALSVLRLKSFKTEEEARAHANKVWSAETKSLRSK